MFIVPVSRDSRLRVRLFDDTVERFFGSVAGAAATADQTASRNPALDIVESETAYSVKLEVPGVTKADIKVSVDGRRVTVQAQSPATAEKGECDRIVYRERSATSYARSFMLPLEVDQADADAKLENGVLTLTLPKRSARSAAQITVN